ncbi:glycosyltransferase [Nodosilinea nodulosa]|uniref:glycosyltransferase n=1 Tax=Nodosilinea nodulosa TaxID=416001 RepID=UPI0002F640BA|nr:glycosyltransferase [Nodosilinea nodulosa]
MEIVEIVVVINSFNRCQLLSEALPSAVRALRQISNKAAIVVFDAGSTDGSIKFIQNYFSQTVDIETHCLIPSLEADRSFSAGCNEAIKFAGQKYPTLKYCFFFETDNLIINDRALILAIQLLEQEQDLGAVGFTVEQCNQRKTGFGSPFPTLLSFVIGQQLSNRLGLENTTSLQWQDFQGTRWGASDIVYTSPLLVRYHTWQVTGGMDQKKFPFSDCDSDWCWSARKQGWRVAVLDLPGVIHDNRMHASVWSGNRVIDFHRARFRLLAKHRGQRLIFLKPLLWVRHCLEAVLLIIKSCFSKRARKSFRHRLILLKTVFSSYEST